MFGILVSQHRVRSKAPVFVADDARPIHARRLTPMLSVIAWLPLVVLTFKKAV